MSDRVIRAHLLRSRLQVVVAFTTETSRTGAELQQCLPTAAGLFAQALTGALLASAVQPGEHRINLQLACDGPLRGLFADAQPGGGVRGFVRNPLVEFPQGPRFSGQAALGRSGYFAVLRDLMNGEVYRGSVDLGAEEAAPELPWLLERYYLQSEQTDTAVALEVLAQGSQVLGKVAGLLVQPMPDGDRVAFNRIADQLRAGWLTEHLATADTGLSWLLPLLGEELSIIEEHGASYTCTCSKERVVRALMTLGKEAIIDLWQKEGKAEARCEFCGRTYVVPGPELLALFQDESVPN
jgi:molecular chaperone Hsp33